MRRGSPASAVLDARSGAYGDVGRQSGATGTRYVRADHVRACPSSWPRRGSPEGLEAHAGRFCDRRLVSYPRHDLREAGRRASGPPRTQPPAPTRGCCAASCCAACSTTCTRRMRSTASCERSTRGVHRSARQASTDASGAARAAHRVARARALAVIDSRTEMPRRRPSNGWHAARRRLRARLRVGGFERLQPRSHAAYGTGNAT